MLKKTERQSQCELLCKRERKSESEREGRGDFPLCGAALETVIFGAIETFQKGHESTGRRLASLAKAAKQLFCISLPYERRGGGRFILSFSVFDPILLRLCFILLSCYCEYIDIERWMDRVMVQITR